MGALSRGERVFASHPVIAIILTPSWVAGIHRPRGIVYQPINALAAAVWAVGIGFGAYLIGPDVVDLADDFGLVSAVVVAFGVAIGVVLEVRHQRRRRDRGLGLERQPATEAAAPAGGPTDPYEPS